MYSWSHIFAVNSLFDSLRPTDDQDQYHSRPTDEENSRNTVNYAQSHHSKRTRTLSPSAAKRDLEAKRLEREKQKRMRRERELAERRQEKMKHFLYEVFAEVPVNGAWRGLFIHDPSDPYLLTGVPSNGGGDFAAEDNYGHHGDGNAENQYEEDEDQSESDEDRNEAGRQAAIEESRRKLAELEADRPIWEQEAKKRILREQAEQRAMLAKVEERRRAEVRKAEAERYAKAQREAQEARRMEEALRREREEAARLERERRQRQQRWSYGPWTAQRALERYKALSEAFDGTKFSAAEPLTSDAVPWPVLQSPVTFSVEDVDWAAVEKFFEAVKPHMRSQDFKIFVEKSHRRFHPDRWRSRSLLKSVVDEAERGCMEVGT